MVCFDSAVEFFFQPAGSRFYYNLEVNCIGTVLLYRNCFENGRKISTPVNGAILKKIKRHSSLPRDMQYEITTPTTWYLSLQIPKEVFVSDRHPFSGQVWRGNVYKCADKTSHPCWLAWKECGTFHEPETFGSFHFEP